MSDSEDLHLSGAGTNLRVHKAPLKRRRHVFKTSRTTDHKTIVASTCYDTMGWKKRFVKNVLTQVPEYTWDIWREEGYRDEEILKELSREHVLPYAETFEDLVSDMRLAYRTRVINAIGPLQNTCYTLSHLMDIIVEYATGLFAGIGAPGARHLYEASHNIDSWEYERDLRYKICNISASIESLDAAKQVNDKLRLLRDDNSTNDFLFHCTNWAGAKSICIQGPKYGKGRPCLDFGHDSSFYVTPSIHDVIDWGRKKNLKWENEVACIVFRGGDHDEFGHKRRVFANAEKEWRDLTTHSRLCIGPNELDKMNMVYGPMVANVEDVVKRKDTSRPHKIPKWQLATKSDVGDRVLKRRILGVLFFSKSP